MINGTEFEIPKESATFLNKYKERIQNYINKHNLDQDLYQDILTGIEEKLQEILDKEDEITQKDCINIVNSLGEPEDIFENEESISIPQTNTHTLQNTEDKNIEKPKKNY